LAHFGRTSQFPPLNGSRAGVVGGGGGVVKSSTSDLNSQLRVFNSRTFKAETSTMALVRLCVTALSLPFLLMLAFPAGCLFLWVTLLRNIITFLFSLVERAQQGERGRNDLHHNGTNSTTLTPELTPMSQPATPFLPQTPFTSPLIASFDLVPPPRRTSPANPAGEVGVGASSTYKRIRSFGDIPMPPDAAASSSTTSTTTTTIANGLPRSTSNSSFAQIRQPPSILRPSDLVATNGIHPASTTSTTTTTTTTPSTTTSTTTRDPSKPAATTPTASITTNNSHLLFPCNNRLSPRTALESQQIIDGFFPPPPPPHSPYNNHQHHHPPSSPSSVMMDANGDGHLATSSSSSLFHHDVKPPPAVVEAGNGSSSSSSSSTTTTTTTSSHSSSSSSSSKPVVMIEASAVVGEDKKNR